MLLVYINNMIVTESDTKEQQALSDRLAKEFEIKALGRLKYFLGIEVLTLSKGFLSLSKSIS